MAVGSVFEICCSVSRPVVFPARVIGVIEVDENGNAIGFETLSLPGGDDFDFAASGQNPRGNPLDIAVDPVTGNVFVASFIGENGNGQIVRLTPTVSVVPEPSSMTLLGLGSFILLLSRRGEKRDV